jgi:hypothetical protein
MIKVLLHNILCQYYAAQRASSGVTLTTSVSDSTRSVTVCPTALMDKMRTAAVSNYNFNV